MRDLKIVLLALVLVCCSSPVGPERVQEASIPIQGYPRWLTLTTHTHYTEYMALEIEVEHTNGALVRMGVVGLPPQAGTHTVRIMVPKADVIVWVRPIDDNGDASEEWVGIRSPYQVDHVEKGEPGA